MINEAKAHIEQRNACFLGGVVRAVADESASIKGGVSKLQIVLEIPRNEPPAISLTGSKCDSDEAISFCMRYKT